MKYAIKDESGATINTIIAEVDFVEHYCRENGFTFERIEQAVPAPIPDPESEQETTIWDELDAAYQKGVNSAYDL